MMLRNKIMALNIGALVLTLLISGPIIIMITDDNNLKTAINLLEGQGNYAANYMEQYVMNKAHTVYDIPTVMDSDASYLCAIIERMAKCRVQIFDTNQLIGDSSDFIGQAAELRPEIKAALQGDSVYYLDTHGKRTLYVALPLNVSSVNKYAIGFVQDLSALNSLRNNMIILFLGASFVSMTFACITSLKISDRLTTPLKKLTGVTKKFAIGELSERTNIASGDEVGDLALAFNRMADNIELMVGTIRDEQNKQKTFFDNFTHEIRTPLTTIIGYTDLLWKTDDEEIKDKSLFYISTESKRMLKMIENLLELSRLKKYGYSIHPVQMNLFQTIQQVCDAMSFKANRYHIEFRTSLENVILNADPDLMKQVIINLIDNAIKYSGTKYIDVRLAEREGRVVFNIQDYGCGISKEDLSQIFDPYFKVEKSRSSEYGGYGLGLAIVKEIIEKHNATINIISKAGEGTTITIEFRRDRNETTH